MLRLGVIGYGDSGRDFARAAQYAEHWEAVAVGGRNMEKAKVLADKLGILALPVEEMVKRPDIDFIAISTPPGNHLNDALKVIEAGKHVIVEKPMALTLQDCDTIIQKGKEKGVIVLVSQSLEFFPGVMKAKELIDAGEIGEIITIHERWCYNYFSGKRVGWQLDPKLSGGGVVLNPVIHLTDRIRYLTGSEVAVVDAAIGYYNKEHQDIEGNVHAFYRLRNGLPASILLNGYDTIQEPISSTIFGTKGVVTISSWAISCFLHKNGQKTEHFGETYMKNSNDRVNVSYLGHMVEWERCFRNHQPLRSPGENGRANVAACLAIFESHKTKKPVVMEEFLRKK
jgi:predicted dehydrogenase